MFVTSKEKNLTDRYIKEGYIIEKVSNEESLRWMKNNLIQFIREVIDIDLADNEILNSFHKKISVENLNDIRVKIIQKINQNKDFRSEYYKIAKPFLDIIVGNEVSMQLRTNLSIQIPNDDSSLLPIHADTWSGDSPFETVVWIPFVDCYDTKSMFILDPINTDILMKNFNENFNKSSDEIYNSIKDKLHWINIKYGEVLIFNQSLPHGNVINKESETRWSMNVRFKGIFTPYGDKKIGEFFEPINLKAASIIGMKYSKDK